MTQPFKSYRDLEVYQLAHKLAVDIHKLTLKELPKFELYEEGNQIRRSSKSVSCNIVEGFGLRRYKNEFIKYLVQAHASCDETQEHLLYVYETESLKNKDLFDRFKDAYEKLSRKLNNFITSVEAMHQGRKL